MACLLLVLLGGRLFYYGKSQKEAGLFTIETTLSLNAPGARKVEVAGDFTDWKKVPLKPQDGHWGLHLTVIPGRVYEYVFILNGRVLLTDPNNARIIRDHHGDLYSILQTTTDRSEVTKMKPIVFWGNSKILSVAGLCLALFSPPAAYADETIRPFLLDIQKQAQTAGLPSQQRDQILE